MGKAKATLDAVGSIADALGGRLKRAADQGHSVARGENWYHGSRRADRLVESGGFSNDHLGTYTGADSASYGHFLSNNPHMASSYADSLPEQIAHESSPLLRRYDDAVRDLDLFDEVERPGFDVRFNDAEGGYDWVGTQYDQWGSEYSWESDSVFDGAEDALDDMEAALDAERAKLEKRVSEMAALRADEALERASGSGVLPVSHNMKNPFEYDFGGGDYRDQSFAELLQEAVDEGHDGAIFRNVADGYGFGREEVGDVAIVFDPKNIRSIYADFSDPTSSNLLAGIKAAAPLTAAAALGYSEDSEAGPISRGGRTLIEAWHGSPHKFDKFSMDKIGTGEGAQAYGHGLYFADAEDVARQYRDDLAPSRGWTPDQIRQHEPGQGAGSTGWQLYDKETGYLNTELPTFKTQEEAQAFIDNADDALGSLYRTEIDIDPDTLLDWDKPLSEQPESVQRAFRDLPDPKLRERIFGLDNTGHELSGGQAYGEVQDYFRAGQQDNIFDGGTGALGQQDASAELRELGIPGIRYLDGMSRNAGDGSYNYVVFDDSKINIVERGAATPEAMAAAAIPGAVGAYANKRAEQKQTLAQTYAKTNPVNLMAAALLSRVDWSHLDDPARGVYGLVASVKSLFEGQGLSEALQQGGRIASQPVEQTAQQVGDAVFDATGSPAAATAALTATNVWGPI